MKYRQSQKGFTLIELLVVIAIIGLLSVIVMASLKTIRAKGRDSARVTGIIQMRTALELYKNTFGYYPKTIIGNSIDQIQTSVPYGDYYCTNGCGLTTFITGVVPTYLKKYPSDSGTPSDTMSTYVSDGNDYFLQQYNFLENDISTNSPFYDFQTTNLRSLLLYSSKSFITTPRSLLLNQSYGDYFMW